MKKILVSDFDQTFHRDEIEIYQNIEAVQQFRKEGNIFVIATGRSYKEFMLVKEKYNLLYDYVLLNNGANILDCTDVMINSIYMDNDTVNDLINNYINDNDKIDFSYTCSNNEESRVLYANNINRVGIYFKDGIDSTFEKKELLNKYKNLNITTGRRTPMIEITDITVNKSTAINRLINIEKLSNYTIHVVGDGDNDVDMLRDYNGVTLDNGTLEAKGVASKIYKNLVEYINTIL